MSNYQVLLVRHKVEKVQFEILCKPKTVPQYREGKLGLDNVLFSEDIYTNAQKGEKAKNTDLSVAYGTENVKDCIKIILEKGEYQESAAERKEKIDQKRKQIVNYFHKYYIDPRTKYPPTVDRVDSALNEIKYNIDPNIPVEKQAADIFKKLIEVMPLRKSEMEATIKVKHQFLGQAHAILHKFCEVRSDSYDNYGASYEVVMLPGDYDPLRLELESLTKGDFDITLKSYAQGASSEEASSSSSKGGKKGGGGKKK